VVSVEKRQVFDLPEIRLHVIDLSTATKQGKNLLDVVTRLFDGRGAWIPIST
jgi:hypothetical protein